MACDMFSSVKAFELLRGKTINFFGDSNVRALYKDLLWLLEDGSLIPSTGLQKKNEDSFANDTRLSSGRLHSGRNYEEVRLYTGNPYISFQFITRLNQPAFIDSIKKMSTKPDVVVINSCVWDLTRWGCSGVNQFKTNVRETLSFLKSSLPSTRIIWLTTLPPSFKSEGGFLTKEIEFLRNMLPWHIVFANKYASDVARSLEVDVLDLHYYFRFLLNYHAKDGIHWTSKAVRHATNMLLTHIALTWNCKLPGEVQLDKTFLEYSQESKQAPGTKSTTISEPKPGSVKRPSTEQNRRKRFRNKNSRSKSNFQCPVSQNLQELSDFRGSYMHEQNQVNLQLAFESYCNANAFNIREFSSCAINSINPFNEAFSDQRNSPTPSVWYNDCYVNNFESPVFTHAQSQQRYPSYTNIQYESRSRSYLRGCTFDRRENVQNPCRVNRRNDIRRNMEANRYKSRYMYRNRRDT